MRFETYKVKKNLEEML